MATIALTKDNLQQTIDDNDIVLIDFWAEWCGPCKMFGPVFEKASEKYPDVAFAKCDTQAQPEVAAAFDVQSIPTLAVFRDKVLLFLQPGALPPQALDEIIDKVKGLDMDEVRATIADEAKAAESGKGPDTAAAPAPDATPAGRRVEDAPAAAPSPAAADEQAKVVTTTQVGEGLAHLSDDFVLRRQGVTRDFLQQARSSEGVARKVLEMYDRVRQETIENGAEGRERMRGELDAWDFDPDRDLQSVDAETRSELKAVLRAIDELMGE